MATDARSPSRSTGRLFLVLLPWLIASFMVAYSLDGSLAPRPHGPMPLPVSPTLGQPAPPSAPAKPKPTLESWEKIPV